MEPGIVANLGDWNGDGLDVLAFGKQRDDLGGDLEGAVYLYLAPTD